MDVIDRYVRTLRILLPKDQRDDIIRELSEEVQSQVGEKKPRSGDAWRRTNRPQSLASMAIRC